MAFLVACSMLLGGCASPTPSVRPAPTATATATNVATVAPSPQPTRTVHLSRDPISIGAPIDIAELSGRIVTDDFEDLFAMDPDGSNIITLADDPAGPEFDGAWSPDGRWVVYRDSTRGINRDDEIFVVRADGTHRRNITNDPGNDWGPDWSPDGSTIVFNSDRGGGMDGYLMNPDGSNVRRIDVNVWVEYPSFSPDGTKIAFMGAVGSNYELYVANLASGAVTQLTESIGSDSWPAWSPDGTTIAFTSERDDCAYGRRDIECWDTGDIGPHHDIWLIEPDGSNLRRVTPEFGQFVAWSPDGRYLLISGYALYVVRPDGSGRLELRAEGNELALGGIPDWIGERP
jgi:TolB protein